MNEELEYNCQVPESDTVALLVARMARQAEQREEEGYQNSQTAFLQFHAVTVALGMEGSGDCRKEICDRFQANKRNHTRTQRRLQTRKRQQRALRAKDEAAYEARRAQVFGSSLLAYRPATREALRETFEQKRERLAREIEELTAQMQADHKAKQRAG